MLLLILKTNSDKKITLVLVAIFFGITSITAQNLDDATLKNFNISHNEVIANVNPIYFSNSRALSSDIYISDGIDELLTNKPKKIISRINKGLSERVKSSLKRLENLIIKKRIKLWMLF